MKKCLLVSSVLLVIAILGGIFLPKYKYFKTIQEKGPW